MAPGKMEPSLGLAREGRINRRRDHINNIGSVSANLPGKKSLRDKAPTTSSLIDTMEVIGHTNHKWELIGPQSCKAESYITSYDF